MSFRLSLGVVPSLLGRQVVHSAAAAAGPSKLACLTPLLGPSYPVRHAIAPSHTRQFAISSRASQAPQSSPRPPLFPTLPAARHAAQKACALGSPIASPSALFGQIFRRAFHPQPARSIRQTYFPRASGGAGPSGSGGWWRGIRRRIDRISPLTLVYGLIAANVIIFLLWQYAIQSIQRFRDPSLYQFLTNNFVLNEANMMAGRVWNLLTACFSHSGGQHIFFNCLSLYFVAPAVASLLGSSAFLGLYLGGGIVASFISLSWHRYAGDRWSGSEGASGAIYACLSFYGAMFPKTTFLLFFVVPMPAWALISGLFAWDTYSAVFQKNSGIDSAGHVGGIIAGLGAALLLRRRGFGRFGRF